MKKNVIVFGLIAGVIVSVWMAITTLNCHDSKTFDPGNSMVLGYASMLLAFSLIFVAVKNYRDKYNGGVVSFGKAFKIGFFIALIASTMYVLVWQVEFFFFVPDFAEKLSEYTIKKMQHDGSSAAQIAAQRISMANFNQKYKNPLFNMLITYVEILPLGLIVTLISALILKRKKGAVAV
ncbi:hypothetical protein GCM10023149_11080 [Mucilaginibacter gynuensis]|uniref:DUF4199 domain-containing protein n=1 Tax=Mucilaginibacter gynuensis TaxID=1302236 RepID=A0ABP8G0Z0_9SPHI